AEVETRSRTGRDAALRLHRRRLACGTHACWVVLCHPVFFFSDPATTEIYTLSLHDALPISAFARGARAAREFRLRGRREHARGVDRKSTRLNSSHVSISYAVFCLKKKKPVDGTVVGIEQ